MKKLILLLLGCCIGVIVEASGTHRPSFFHYIPTSGYDVRSFCEDQTGMLWLGTSAGLRNYTELQAGKQYLYPQLQALNVPITGVQCDNEGSLWIRTDLNTILVYHPRTGELITDVEKYLQSMQIPVWYDFGLQIDKAGRIWLWKDGMLYCRDMKRRQTRKIRLEASTDQVRPYTICFSENRVWIISNRQFTVVEASSMRILYHEPVTFSLSAIPYLTVTRNGVIWLGIGRQVYVKPRMDVAWNPSIHLPSDVVDLIELPEGGMAVGTTGTGLMIYDDAGNLETHYMSSPFDNGSLRTDHLLGMAMDRQGRLFLSYTKRGFSIRNAGQEEVAVRHIRTLRKERIEDDILSFSSDQEGNIWIGTDGEGAFWIDKDGRESAQPVQPKHAILSQIIDRKGRHWLVTYEDGIFCLDQGKWRRYAGEGVYYALAEGDDGQIYVGAHRSGFYCINPETGRETLLTDVAPYIMEVKRGINGLMYAASTDGLLVYNTRNRQSKLLIATESGKSSFSRRVLQSVLPDSRNLVWMICDCGWGRLNMLDRSRDRLYTFPELENYHVRSMAEDKQGNIWLSSDKGLIELKPQLTHEGTYQFKILLYPLQAQPDYNFRAAATLRDGRLAFGTIDGYQLIEPQKLEQMYERQMHLPISLASLAINNQPVLPGMAVNGRVILEEQLAYVKRIRLHYDENNLQFGLYSPDFESPFRQVYRYRLLPLYKSPQLLKDNHLSLNNLPPGTYRLQIQQMKADEADTTNLLELEIIIEPPFWLSGWAYATYFLLLVLVVGGIIYYLHNRQQYRLKLNQMQIEAERQHQLNEMKLRFFTNISHDLRTPLSLIITPLSDFIDRSHDEQTKRFLQPVHRNALRLLNLVNQILDFRKLEVYGHTLNRSYGDIVTFMKEVCASFSQMADESHLKLTVTSNVDKLEMSFDKDKLTKIMMNLLSNACKYSTTDGRVEVVLEVWNTELRINVADTGIGISDEDKKHIFERFYQAGGENRSQMGNGIGLHIVKEFVELHGGKIEVSDNTPCGTVFSFTLPIVKENALVAEAEEQEEVVENQLPTSNSRKTILLVEDNFDFLAYMADSLSDVYNIVQAHNGKEALRLMEQVAVDVIISDVMMAEMDGLTLCHEIKSHIETSHIPVILLTAKTLEEDILKGLEMGADDYITKPFNMAILRHRVHALIARNQSSHERFKNEVEISPSEITITSLDEALLNQAIAIVEEHIDDADFTIEMLSAALHMHRTHLYKKLLFITGKSPLEFIRLIRLKRARQLLDKSQLYVSEIAYRVGFNTPRIFAKYFKEEFGMTPSEYAKSQQEQTTSKMP